MASTLGEFLSFESNIDTMGVKVRATQETDLEFSVYMTDAKDDKGNNLKVYGSSVHMYKTDDYKWIELPINLYFDSSNIIVKLVKNPSILVAEETWNNVCLAAG